MKSSPGRASAASMGGAQGECQRNRPLLKYSTVMSVAHTCSAQKESHPQTDGTAPTLSLCPGPSIAQLWWAVKGCRMAGAWRVQGKCIASAQRVHGRGVASAWQVHGQCMAGARQVRGRCKAGARQVHRASMACARNVHMPVHGRCVDECTAGAWQVHGRCMAGACKFPHPVEPVDDGRDPVDGQRLRPQRLVAHHVVHDAYFGRLAACAAPDKYISCFSCSQLQMTSFSSERSCLHACCSVPSTANARMLVAACISKLGIGRSRYTSLRASEVLHIQA